MFRKILTILLFVGFVCCAFGAVIAYREYLIITRDLPNFATVDDYSPPAVSNVYARDGTLIAELYRERRYPVKFSQIPELVRNCFLASEDASFYKHPGIDIFSILRAAIKNFRSGKSSQGGSTITQQVVKNLLLSPEKSIRRKLKEAILSYRLEKRLSKDEILEIYLNQIFFGNFAYGIRAAAKAYYHKELDQLTLAEAAILAGLPKAPSKYSPLLNMDGAKVRQKYVLKQMLEAGFATKQQIEEAEKEKITVYPASAQNIFHSPYYVTEIREQFRKRWKNYDIDVDGLEIHTGVDLNADQIATSVLQEGLKKVDKRRGWRGPIEVFKNKNKESFISKYGERSINDLKIGKNYPALIVANNKKELTVDLGKEATTVSIASATWISKKDLLIPGAVIEVSLSGDKIIIDQTPEIEGAFVLLNPYDGQVNAMVGGYSYERSQFNRVTQSLRQPGSAFKPLVYLAAVDGFDYTPSTIVSDAPRTFKWGDDFWTPQNYDEEFLGPITLQTALERSRNLVSADIVSKIGVDAPIQYAKKLGIDSPMGRNLSLALGSSEVTLLELARAYGAIATQGVLTETITITKIKDRKGNVIFDVNGENTPMRKQVVTEESAFILSHMMRGVIDRGTATVIKPLGRAVAGKTGTTNNSMDVWFVGFTPHWVAGVWVGFDVKKEIGKKETGGRIGAPIWLDFMQKFLANEDKTLAPEEFRVPLGVVPYWVNKDSGREVSEGTPGAILEYFKQGTSPNTSGGDVGVTEGTVDSADAYLDEDM